MIVSRIFRRVNCAKCGIRANKPIKAYTAAGAIRKATIECEGIKHAKDGTLIPTECYRGELLDGMIDALRSEEQQAA